MTLEKRVIGMSIISVLLTISLTFGAQFTDTKRGCWAHVPESYVGFPFDVVLENHLECFASGNGWVARRSVYFMDERYFTEYNLKNLFNRVSESSRTDKEIRIFVVSDANIARWLMEPRVGGISPERDKGFQDGLSLLHSGQTSFALFHRMGADEAFWYYRPGEKVTGQPHVRQGRDPFHADEISFPFQIAEADLIPDGTGVECDVREFRILIRRCDFSDANLLQLLSWISTRFPVPIGLRVWVRVDRREIETSLTRGYDVFSIMSWNLREPFDLAACPEERTLAGMGAGAAYSRWKTGADCNVYDGHSRVPRKLEIPRQGK